MTLSGLSHGWRAATPLLLVLSHAAVLLQAGMAAAEEAHWVAAADPGRVEGQVVLLEGSADECGSACGKVLLVGVRNEPSPTPTASVYEPANDRWTPVTAPSGLAPKSLTVLRGTRAECGDRCGQVLVKFLRGNPLWALYDPKADTWSATSPPAFPRRLGASTTLIGGTECSAACGKVLVLGGQNDQGPQSSKEDNQRSLQSAELYDPLTNAWSLTAAPGLPGLDDHLAAALSDGRVLVAGGALGNTAKVYDPASASWGEAPAPATSRVRPFAEMVMIAGTACGSACGKVLAVGGDGAPELYDPKAGVSGAWARSGACPACSGEPTVSLLDGGDVLVVTRSGTAVYGAVANAWRDGPTIPRTASVGELVVLSRAQSVCGDRCGAALSVGVSSADLLMPRSTGEGTNVGTVTAEQAPASGDTGGGRRPLVLAAVAAGLVAATAGGLRLRRRRQGGDAR